MKKKIFFIISAILQIMLAVLIIVTAEQIVQNQIEMYSESQNEVMKKTIELLRNKGVQIVIGESIIIILLNIFELITAIKNKILPRKGLMITCTAITFFLSNHTLINLLCVAGLIILICSQRKNPEDFPKEIKEIPKIEYEKSTISEKISAIILAIVYFSQLIIGKIIPQDTPQNVRIIIVAGYYILTLLIALIAFRKKLIHDLKLLKNNFASYMKFILPRYGLAFLMLMVTNAICLRITNQATSVNQSHINSMPIWVSAPLAILWAPIVEECVFRGCLRRFIKNDVIFIIISAILFGSIHTLNETTILNKIVMTIPYATLGGILAYMYAKSENITTNMITHFLQNTVATIVGILISTVVMFSIM